MKPLLFLGIMAAIIYGGVKIGKYLGRKTTPPDWEPANNSEDQSDNMFV